MGVHVVKRGSPPKFNVSGALDWLAAQAIGIIQRRTARGLDVDGKSFAPYSTSYRNTLRKMGESSKVDLTVTGAMLADLVVIEKRIPATGPAYIVVGPGNGTSERRRPPTKAHKGKPRAMHTGKRSPPHSVLAGYHQRGDASRGRPARRWLGLSPIERGRLAMQLARRLTKAQQS